MTKTSRSPKAPSSQVVSNRTNKSDSGRKSTTVHRAPVDATKSTPVEQTATFSPQYPFHGVPPQQYHPVQFVHVPYSYPYMFQASPAHQNPPLVPAQPQPHPLAHAPPPSQTAPPSPPAQPPTLESVFRETVQKLHDLEMTLSNTQAVTKRALVRHQHELQKWKTHCMSFKQERDEAREMIKTLMTERAKLLNREPNIPPEMLPVFDDPSCSSQSNSASTKVEAMDVVLSPSRNLKFIQTDLSSEQRKASRASRRHSPYSSPTAGPSRRPSLPEVLPALGLGQPACSIIPRARASSAPPSLAEQQKSRAPVLLIPSHSCPSPTLPVDERLRGFEFATFSPVRQQGDATAFNVAWTREPMELEYPPSTSPSSVRVRCANDCYSDMELESDDEVQAAPPTAGLASSGPCAPPCRPTVTVDHVDLLYTPVAGKLWCRLCMLEHYRIEARIRPQGLAESVGPFPSNPKVTNFEPNSSWQALRHHWTTSHPAELEKLASLSAQEICRLRESRARPLSLGQS